MKVFRKDEVGQLDYVFDFCDWLTGGDYIADATFILPPGLDWISSKNTSKTATVWVSGGTQGESYRVDCIVTTASHPPRIAKKSITLEIT